MREGGREGGREPACEPTNERTQTRPTRELDGWMDRAESRCCHEWFHRFLLLVAPSSSSSAPIRIPSSVRPIGSDESEVTRWRGATAPCCGRGRGRRRARGHPGLSSSGSRFRASFWRCRFRADSPSSTALSENVLSPQASTCTTHILSYPDQEHTEVR